MRKLLFIFLNLSFVCLAYCGNRENYIIVNSKTFQLQVYDENDKLLGSYFIGIGKNGTYKTTEGDFKTPIGEYEILWKASAFYEEDGGYPLSQGVGYGNSGNTFSEYKKLKSIPLYVPAYGGEESVVMCLNYPNASDREKGYTGGGIAIHATQLGGIGEYVSQGCIRMYPQDARDLYNLIDVGSKVTIR